MATEYYAEELTSVPFKIQARLFLNSLPGWMAYPMAAYFRGRGILRWPLTPTHAVGGVGSGRTVQESELPPRATSRWAPLVEQFVDLGFRHLKYSMDEVIGGKEHAAVTFLSGDGSIVATVEWICLLGDTEQDRTTYELNSYADHDPEFMTAAMHPDDLVLAEMLTLDFVESKSHSMRLPVRRVVESHQARIQGRSVFHMTPEAALAEHARRAARRFQWALETGLLRRLRPREVTALKRR